MFLSRYLSRNCHCGKHPTKSRETPICFESLETHQGEGRGEGALLKEKEKKPKKKKDEEEKMNNENKEKLNILKL